MFKWTTFIFNKIIHDYDKTAEDWLFGVKEIFSFDGDSLEWVVDNISDVPYF